MNVKPKFMKKLWYFEFLAINRSGGTAVKDKMCGGYRFEKTACETLMVE